MAILILLCRGLHGFSVGRYLLQGRKWSWRIFRKYRIGRIFMTHVWHAAIKLQQLHFNSTTSLKFCPQSAFPRLFFKIPTYLNKVRCYLVHYKFSSPFFISVCIPKGFNTKHTNRDRMVCSGFSELGVLEYFRPPETRLPFQHLPTNARRPWHYWQLYLLMAGEGFFWSLTFKKIMLFCSCFIC